MLAIDIMFFLLELSVGMAVSSLALLADAFHMLNDIISLLVGLWAVSVARKATTDKFSYGWLRAEILGAFFNAVFLIALCVSIVLEALTRFLDPPKIDNPKLILIVGSLGLASNLVGFLVLGGHGHSHGPGDHSHDHDESEHSHGDAHGHAHSHDIGSAEEGRAGVVDNARDITDENGRVIDLLPEATVARFNAASNDQDRGTSRASGHSRRRTPVSSRHGRLTSIDDIAIHPASFRQEIIEASRPRPEDDSSSDSNMEDETAVLDETEPAENTPLIQKAANGQSDGHHGGHATSCRNRRDSTIHRSHNHRKPKRAGKGHGHSHGDMGMNAMVLHVLGDALGNVGVIATALVIWLTEWKGRFYADPAVSLFITLIILRSAIPLTVAASKILLQATPDNIDLDDVRRDMLSLPGVLSCHHLHIWQLSDTTVVASMHLELDYTISEDNGQRYMELSRQARECLHAYGIHSATIQPEFCNKRLTYAQVASASSSGSGSDHAAKCGKTDENGCLLQCVEDCAGQGCCPGVVSRPESSHSHSDGGHSSHSHH